MKEGSKLDMQRVSMRSKTEKNRKPLGVISVAFLSIAARFVPSTLDCNRKTYDLNLLEVGNETSKRFQSVRTII